MACGVPGLRRLARQKPRRPRRRSAPWKPPLAIEAIWGFCLSYSDYSFFGFFYGYGPGLHTACFLPAAITVSTVSVYSQDYPTPSPLDLQRRSCFPFGIFAAFGHRLRSPTLWGSHRIFSDKFMHAGAWECLIRTRSIKALPTGRLVRWFARSSSPEPRLFPSQSTRPFLSKDVGLNCFLTPGRKLAGKLLSNRITSVPWHGWFLWACSMRC